VKTYLFSWLEENYLWTCFCTYSPHPEAGPQFVRSEVVFLEAPSLSLQHWNHSREHKNYKEFIEQDKKLELQLDQLNIKIRELNKSDNRSPRFMLDLWRGSKVHNKKSVTKTYTDLNLLEKDGMLYIVLKWKHIYFHGWKKTICEHVPILHIQRRARSGLGCIPSFSRRLRSVYVFVTDFLLCPLEPLHRSNIKRGAESF
jgi:hypothetical protein